MATNSGHNTQLYKSRKTIIDFLEVQGYNVEDYKNFSIHEVHTMNQSKQLDMLFKKPDESKKAYVKFYLGNSLRAQNIYEIIDDLFNLEVILEKKDDLIIITKDHPNESLLNALKHIWEQDKVFVTVFGIARLQYNVLNHELVPPHIALTNQEAEEIKKKFFITNDNQIPDIHRFSPVAQAIGLRPGDLCKIIRPSKTAINSEFYRICSS